MSKTRVFRSPRPGGQLQPRPGGGDDGVPDRVRSTSALLGTGRGLSQAVLRAAAPAAHFHRLRLEDVLRQVGTGR